MQEATKRCLIMMMTSTIWSEQKLQHEINAKSGQIQLDPNLQISEVSADGSHERDREQTALGNSRQSLLR